MSSPASKAAQAQESSSTDAVLLAKHWVASSALSQPPLLLLHTSATRDLDWTQLPPAGRNPLLPRAQDMRAAIKS